MEKNENRARLPGQLQRGVRPGKSGQQQNWPNCLWHYSAPGKGQTDPATRTFQALRIAVNDELHQLEAGLSGALNILRADGRIVVVDFHSLEDRIVKNFFAANTAKKVHVSRYKEPGTDKTAAQTAFSFSSKAILPSEQECRENPRAHSAKLRYAIKRKEQNNE